MTDHTKMARGSSGLSNRRWLTTVTTLLLAFLLAPHSAVCQADRSAPLPIIDMHVHVFGTGSAPSPEEKAALEKMASSMRAANVAKAFVGGPSEYREVLRRALPEVIVPSEVFPFPFDELHWPDVANLRLDHAAGRLGALGEVLAQLNGIAPTDSRLEPYWALAEELDIPVGYHVGFAPPGVNYPGLSHLFAPRYRMSLSDPLLLEDVLIRHPKLRLYVMHAGWPMLDRTLGLLYAHPQVYVEVGWLDRLPLEEYHRYLKRLVDAGFGDRILFGSDQIPETWPGGGIEAIEAADFLTAEQKRNIFFNNAARFLGLSD
jgi:predicted TIM-barrel fold metal-dependent hydrolase